MAPSLVICPSLVALDGKISLLPVSSLVSVAPFSALAVPANRDKTDKLIINLLLGQPKLLPLGLRTILLDRLPFSKSNQKHLILCINRFMSPIHYPFHPKDVLGKNTLFLLPISSQGRFG